MFLERGGSATFARHAFNELISFIAGWAILIDYLIVIALAAISVPHYLTPVSSHLNDAGVEVAVSALVIGIVAAINILGATGHGHQGILTGLALGDLLLQVGVIVVGVSVAFHPDLLTAELDLFSQPTLVDAVYAAVLATLALAGLEATSNLAPDVQFEPRDLKRVIGLGAVLTPLLYTGVAAIALMAVPVVAAPEGPQTALAGPFIEAPLLGVVGAYEPDWLGDTMKWMVVAVATPVLIWAANTSMLGLSRHAYVLATNRQIPSWLGKLNRSRATPHVAILAGAAIALALVVPTDVEFLAGLYAFGVTLALAIAHLSILRLRASDPDRERPFRIPGNLRIGRTSYPVPAILGALVAVAAWGTVIAYHDTARWVGAGWMAFGLVGYVIYRRVVEGTSLTRRVTVPSEALVKERAEFEYARILVPVFGTELDDDIVSTAGRLAAAQSGEEIGVNPEIELIHVVPIPLALPLDAELPRDRVAGAEHALHRAREVADEYDSVRVKTALVPARSVGAGIVEEARRRDVEAIVMGGEPPTRIKGGAVIGGIAGAHPPEIGEVTEYVLRKAPCPVLLTAPPEETEAEKGASTQG
jgi:APA family basic amino acid/polyamine antiporter